MALLDHFRPPLSTLRHWEAFHTRWASAIADQLNREVLPSEYFAEPQVHVGSRVEVDVAAFEEGRRPTAGQRSDTPGASLRVWTPSAPAFVLPMAFPDRIEVLIFNSIAGPTLVAAVELVSPGNKDRPTFRRAFAVKCASYLQEEIGLVVVDVVTTASANLHNDLVRLIEAGDASLMAEGQLYAAAYRPRRAAGSDTLEVWQETLALNRPLPALPLALDRGICVPLDLGAAYEEACEASRLPSP
jgi:hypothetical protein